MQIDKLFISEAITWGERRFLWATSSINICSYSMKVLNANLYWWMAKLHFSKRQCQCLCQRLYMRDRLICIFIILWTPPESIHFLSNLGQGYPIIWFSFCFILLCLAKTMLVCLRCSYWYFRSLNTETVPDGSEQTWHLLWKETDFLLRNFTILLERSTEKLR